MASRASSSSAEGVADVEPVSPPRATIACRSTLQPTENPQRPCAVRSNAPFSLATISRYGDGHLDGISSDPRAKIAAEHERSAAVRRRTASSQWDPDDDGTPANNEGKFSTPSRSLLAGYSVAKFDGKCDQGTDCTTNTKRRSTDARQWPTSIFLLVYRFPINSQLLV